MLNVVRLHTLHASCLFCDDEKGSTSSNSRFASDGCCRRADERGVVMNVVRFHSRVVLSLSELYCSLRDLLPILVLPATGVGGVLMRECCVECGSIPHASCSLFK